LALARGRVNSTVGLPLRDRIAEQVAR
jgi:hypothetical protein